MRRHKLVLAAVLLTFLGFAPLLCVLLSGALNALFGCHVGHGQAPACLRLGLDLTPMLVGLGMVGWWMLISWLLFVPAAIIWLIVIVRGVARRMRLIASGAPDPRDG